MNLQSAQIVSSAIRAILAPECLRCEVDGSIRRESENPGDIDIVCIPAKVRPPVEFGQRRPAFATYFELRLWELEQARRLTKTAGGDKLKKYTLLDTNWGAPGQVAYTVKMQITIATPETWAYWHAIRTGPADFSHWLVTPKEQGGALPDGMHFKDCRLWPGPVDTLDEIDIFKALGLPWLEPRERRAAWKR